MNPLRKIEQVPINAAGCAFSHLIESWTAEKIVHEEETTKINEPELTKREYRSKCDIAISKINAQKDILEIYFEHSFKEMKYVFEVLFNALDKGIKTNNEMVISCAMQGIITTMQYSPLYGVNDFIRQLENQDVNELEISKINAPKDNLKIYFEDTFKDRKDVFKAFFKELYKGIEINNDMVISIAMHGIISIMHDSPLQDVIDSMRQLEDPDVTELQI